MSNVFEAMMNQYENAGNTTTNTSSKKYDLKNYFSTYLKEGVNSATKQIRILPPSEGETTPFTVMWGHKAKVDGSWKTFPCLKHEEGEACPFCEARQALLATGKESDKELAKKYSARMMYVVKVIDRDNPHEGVKFWRFNHNYKKDGILDKIMGAVKAAQHDITDPESGRDISLDIQRDPTNGIPGVKSVNNVMQQTPLSDDPEQMKTWLDDNRTWRDVYSTRQYDYLAIVVGGETPMWDKEKEKYVSKESKERESEQTQTDELDSELTMGMQTETETTPNVVNVNEAKEEEVTPVVNTVTVTETTSTVEDEDDDLPF
tara:strand:- start:6190 stop:7143 length:954 start_codon:yes stop_codon:yes gene_type:complete